MQISLTEPQSRMFVGEEKFKLFLGGFGSGKTETKLLAALNDLTSAPGSNVAIYAPSYDLLKLNTMPRIERLVEAMGFRYRMNKSDYTVEIPGLGNIIMRSLQNPERIIAYEVYRSHVDELDTLPTNKAQEAWNKILGRNRLKGYGENRVSAYTTPEGFKFCYQRWEKNPTENYKIYRAPTHSNPHLPEDYIETLRDTYPAELIDAYIEGKFVNLTSGAVYKAYDRNLCRSFEVIRPGDALAVGMDFNVANMSAVVYVRRRDPATPDRPHPVTRWHAVEELVGVYDTPAMVEILRERYQCNGHHVTVYPDASGDSRKSVDASKSDLSLLQDAGFAVYAHAKNPLVKDRVLSANQAFTKGLVLVNDYTCPELASNLEQLVYDRNGEPDKSMNIDHLPDAATYPIAYEMPVVKPAIDLDVRIVT